MEVLAKRLKWLREKKRLSQKEIAAEIGMSLNGYQKIEYGDRDPKLDVLIYLAKFYEVSSDFILGISNTSEQLNKISDQINKAMIVHDTSSKIHTQITYELTGLQLKKHEVINREPKDEEILRNISREIERLKDKEKEIAHQMYSSLNQYFNYLIKYVHDIMNIPEVNVLEDHVIEEIAPLHVRLEQSTYGDYDVRVDSKEKGHIGNLGESLNIEQSNELIEKFEYVFRDILY